jgi:hypothetical protein
MPKPKPICTAEIIEDNDRRRFTVIGQEARTLVALVKAGQKGCTALEVSSWALRFAAYTHNLRHGHGLDIITQHEQHDGGWHGRHILTTPVNIIEASKGLI